MEKDVEKDQANVVRKRSFWLPWYWLIVGIVVGMVGFMVFRMARAKSPFVHYHANFAVYINGQHQTFQGPGYYEEVTACNLHNANDVKSRVHMHDNINHVIHVHANGVTWSDFFNNIGYTLGDNVLSDGSSVYTDGQNGAHLTFILNGQPVTSIADTVIKSEDALLINYGTDSDQVILQRYQAIPKDAHYFNTHADPAACSGSDKFDWKARLKDAVGIRIAQV